MAERSGSVKAETTGNDSMADFHFKPLDREEYYLDDVLTLYFQVPDSDRCPSYLDVVRLAPLELTPRQKKQAARHELAFSYCRWDIESGDGQFSVSLKVKDIVASNDNFNSEEEGIVYVAQYVVSPNNKVIAESSPFRIYPVLEESTMNLPEAFSDDGLIVLGSGSESEPELLDEEPEKNSAKSDRDGMSEEDEELTIVMTERELRNMEKENRASNEKLRSFIDQYKNDLLELTKCNETLKQKLYDEQYKVTNLERAQSKMSTQLIEVRSAKIRLEAILKETIAERERKLREEQSRNSKLEEEVSILNGQVENLRCCVDAHLETKNLLMAEMDSLRVKQELDRKTVLDKATSTLQDPIMSTRDRASKETSERSRNTELEDRVEDLTKRLQSAKIAYISLYKENKRKEKALENICNWASLAKDGMSLEAPGPSQVPSLLSLTRNKFSSSFDESLPRILKDPPSAVRNQVPSESSPKTFAGFPSVKPRTSGLESLEDDLVQLSSDSKLPLPPRQKRKYDPFRKTATGAPASVQTTAATRAMQRGKMVVRGRHRANEAARFPLKREIPAKEVFDYSHACLLPTASAPKPAQGPRSRIIFKKKEAPKPSAPEASSVDESAQESSAVLASAPQPSPRGTNTYSAAELISDLETDASNTEEEPSVINPNICPLCVTSILDYEAHMREAHQKQPCPICGHVFDTDIPLYVMTYHIERHLEEAEVSPETQ
ncbi:uncharacterized protein LOC100905144 [Galendromus occidentalis]|uniref:Uncharacterized protein LOC100905144 n=1 Tax=Galendromus occidentalis TaxID=34638 RepID=A0AAJ7SFD0_9ACAR|nr:uncharacterized protein LOC100905144 [Galendromus occidentalis]